MKIQTELKQRRGDGRWELLGLVPDQDATWHYDLGLPMPQKWITLKVYDYLIEEFEI